MSASPGPARTAWQPVLIVGLIVLAGAVATALALLMPRAFERGPDNSAFQRADGGMMMHGMITAGMVRPTAGAHELMVGVGDYWFKPSATRLRAGRYRLSAHNYGAVEHDVMIERVPIEFENGQPVDEAAPFGVEGLKPRSTMSSTAVLTAGKWELFCSLPGHYASGQRAVIEVYGSLPRGTRDGESGMTMH